MDITRCEFDDVLAQVIAQKHMMNAILITLRHKQALSDKDFEEMFEATLAAIERVPDPMADAVAAYVENLRIASQPET